MRTTASLAAFMVLLGLAVVPVSAETAPPTATAAGVEVSVEMKDFLTFCNGDDKQVAAGVKKYAAADIKNPDNMGMYALQNPTVMKKEQRDGNTVYTVDFKMKYNIQMWEVAWSAGKITALKQLGFKPME